MKQFFCRLLGHTWIHRVDDPKIRWTTAKSLNELELTVDGEPVFYQLCVRCGARRPWDGKGEPESARSA